MAYEILAKKKKIKDPAAIHTSVSMSIEVGLLSEMLRFAREKEYSKSEALRYLLEEGLHYETLLLPDKILEADKKKQLANAFLSLRQRFPELVDLEDEPFYYNNNGSVKVDGSTSGGEARATWVRCLWNPLCMLRQEIRTLQRRSSLAYLPL